MTMIDPGEGWRLLVNGEKINENTDQVYRDDLKKWIPIITLHGHEWNEFNHYPVRRKIGASVNPSHVEVTTSGPYVAIEAHCAALAEIERLKAELGKRCEIWRIARDIAANERDAAESEVKRLKAELDAVKNPQSSPEPEWFDLTPFGEHVLRSGVDWFVSIIETGVWKVVNALDGESIKDMNETLKTQFRCLLKDAPPELVAMASKPVEDPDEWVTQDRVPARPGIDQRNYLYHYEKSAAEYRWADAANINWKTMPKHGELTHSGDMVLLRCRRRDLPPMPEQKPKTEHEVLLYWYDGNVVGMYADCPPTDQSFIPLIVRDGKVFIETETREVVR